MNLHNKMMEIKNNSNLFQYLDEIGFIRLSIFKSGIDDVYICVEEDPIFGTSTKSYTAEEILIEYGITKFLRKQKLDKINDCKL